MVETRPEAVERELKPELPPLMKETFDRRPHTTDPQPEYARRSAAFHGRKLPQLPPLYDVMLAGIITSEPETQDRFGTDVQTWGQSKHTLLSLSERGRMYLGTKIHEKVQDLAPGPFKDTRRIQVCYHSQTPHASLVKGSDVVLYRK